MTEIGKLIILNNLSKEEQVWFQIIVLHYFLESNFVIYFLFLCLLVKITAAPEVNVIYTLLSNDTPLQRNIKKKERKVQTK